MHNSNSKVFLFEEHKRRSVYFHVISFIGIFFLFLLGSVAFLEGNRLLGSLDYFFALALAGLNIYSYKINDSTLAIDIGIAGVAMFFMYLFASGGVNDSACLWYYTFPLISFFLLGATKGILTSSFLLAFSIFVFLTDKYFPFSSTYLFDFKLRFTASYIVVTMFAYIYEIYREKSEQVLHEKLDVRNAELIEANSHLKKEIEERKRAEWRLAEAHQRLVTVLDSFDALVSVIDLDSHEVLFVNQCAKDVYGDITGKICWRSMHKDLDGPCPFCPNEKLIDNKRNPTAPFTWELRNDLVGRWFEHRDRAIRWYGNRLVKIQIATDVTNRKHTEEELLKIKKLESVGLLAGGIAHDFNNVLAAILGNINLALFDRELTDKTRHFLAEAEKASLRAKDITQHLLIFSKGGEPIKEPSNLESLIRDSVNFVLPGDRVICQYSIPKNLWLVDIDRGQISRIIQNIILNASQAMPKGGKIEIGCENFTASKTKTLPSGNIGHFVKIFFKDNGSGIPEKIIDKIFDPYFSTKQGGSGLGLAICQSIIQKHDGEIYVESSSGEGSTFLIYLPASESTECDSQEHLDNHATPLMLKTLVMDDEELVRNVAEAVLKELGHEVILTKDGAEAIQVYREAMEKGNPFQLVIMDLTIPGGMGGEAAVREITRLDSGAKVIVASGYSKDPIMAHYEEYGFCAAIAKPFQLKDFENAINKCFN